MQNLKKQAIIGVKWTSLSIGIRSVLQLIQLVVLARFLSADDFGLVAIVMVVIGFSQLFMDMGISNAIIHKQEITNIQLSSLYWLNIFSGIGLTVIVFLISPIIARFYNNEGVIPLLQLLSFSFVINAVGNQYRVLLRKELKFNILAKIEVIADVGAFICAIILAIEGFGAYSLVFATLTTAIISNLMLVFIGFKTHKPQFTYQHHEIISFLNFGLYQMGQTSIVYFNNKFDVILIGKLLGTEALGIYSLIKQLVMRPSQVINPVITGVTFPIMAKVQNDLPQLKSIYLKIINYLSSINFPIYILMVVLASLLVTLLLGEKWINAIELFQMLSVYALVRSTTSPAGSLLLSRGRADIGFWWSIGEFMLMPLIIYIFSHWGLLGIAFGLFLFQIIMLFPNWYFIVKKMCNASFMEYFRVQVQPLLTTILSVCLAVWFTDVFHLDNIMQIITISLITVSLYVLLSFWLNNEFIREIKNIIFKKEI